MDRATHKPNISLSEIELHRDYTSIISKLSTRFINVSPKRIESCIQEAIIEIGEASGVDRSYVFLFSEECTRFSCEFEWCSQETSMQKPYLQNLKLSDFPWSQKQILRRDVVHIEDVANMPLEAVTEQREFLHEEIRSLVDVPMVAGNSLLGFLGFESLWETAIWSTDAITLLKIVGEVWGDNCSMASDFRGGEHG